MGGLRKQLLHQRRLGVVQVAAVAVRNTPEPAVAVPPAVVDRVAVHKKAGEQTVFAEGVAIEKKSTCQKATRLRSTYSGPSFLAKPTY
jgi:hypothetical protein